MSAGSARTRQSDGTNPYRTTPPRSMTYVAVKGKDLL